AEGLNEYDAAVAARPSLAEELTIQTGISFSKELGTRLHILHISSKEGVDLVAQAQAQGLNVTGETCPHYLYLTNEDFEEIGNMMKAYPLVKFEDDQERLERHRPGHDIIGVFRSRTPYRRRKDRRFQSDPCRHVRHRNPCAFNVECSF